MSRVVGPSWNACVSIVGRGVAAGLLLSVATLALGGCAVGPDFKKPALFAPASWFAARPKPAAPISVVTAAPLDPAWWNVFNDPELSSLESRVADANLDVRTSTLRLAESRAQRRIAAADQFPQINGNGSYTREKASNRGLLSLFGSPSGSSSVGPTGTSGAYGTSANGTEGNFGVVPIPGSTTASSGSSVSTPFNLWQYGFDASWELDLWGRVRREIEGADASLEASADARRNSLLSVLAEVARDYINLRGQQTILGILNQNIVSERDSLTLTRQRYAGGVTTELDVDNAAAQLASTQSQLPQVQQQIAAQINALSFLLAETPGALSGELSTPAPVPPVPPTVPVGLPSELARRRPDIRQAEAQLHSATADVGVAVADFFPRITLSGSLSLQALQFKNLGTWDARQYALGPSITLPIFEGGRLRGTLRLRQAEQQEAAISYQSTVLQALHDVDNALTAYADEQRRQQDLQQAVSSSARALYLARARYVAGVTDFLNTLEAQRTLLDAQQQAADSTVTLSMNLVQLYKALGGGWESKYPLADAK